MLDEVLLPQWGMAMTEGTIIRWFYAEGDEVDEEADLVEVETSKVVGVVPMPAKGRLMRIAAQPDETVAVWSVLAVIEIDSD